MGKEVNLNSSGWCDFVFEGKNKKYGAYYLRQTSSGRHILAFFIVLIFTGVVSAIPMLMEVVKANQENLGGVDEAFELTNMDAPEEIPEENIIREEIAPPPPPLRATIQFTPPVITEDEKVTDDNQMKSQDELVENKDVIGSQTVEGTGDENAQTIDDLKDRQVQLPPEPEPDKPFVSVEQMPQYPGGNGELMKFLSSNIRYPTIAAENGIEGRVIIRFVVGKDGTVSDIQVQRGLDASCDKEAVRVVKMMPKWIPGKQNGRAVPVYFTLPVVFKLQK